MVPNTYYSFFVRSTHSPCCSHPPSIIPENNTLWRDVTSRPSARHILRICLLRPSVITKRNISPVAAFSFLLSLVRRGAKSFSSHKTNVPSSWTVSPEHSLSSGLVTKVPFQLSWPWDMKRLVSRRLAYYSLHLFSSLAMRETRERKRPREDHPYQRKYPSLLIIIIIIIMLFYVCIMSTVYLRRTFSKRVI